MKTGTDTKLTDIHAVIPDDELQQRMTAARKRAEWELGDASWAGVIIRAFLNPVEDAEALAAEMDA